jgi:hypothetical protein
MFSSCGQKKFSSSLSHILFNWEKIITFIVTSVALHVPAKRLCVDSFEAA